MGQNALRPDRRLEFILGYDEDGNLRQKWRTEWWLQGHMIDATEWTFAVAEAIRDGLEADEGYLAVLHRHVDSAA
jgi:hypothetical protein